MIPFEPDETMLNNYIQNKLSETDAEKLELWLSDHPDVMHDLEIGVMFKQADFDPQSSSNEISNKSWLQTIFSKPKILFSHFAVLVVGMLLSFAQINTFTKNTGFISKDVIVKRVISTRNHNHTNRDLNTYSKKEIGDSTQIIFEVPLGKNSTQETYFIDVYYFDNKEMNFNNPDNSYKHESLEISAYNYLVRLSLNTNNIKIGHIKYSIFRDINKELLEAEFIITMNE
jgi:hypothetical protein